MSRIIVTGGNGQLGSALKEIISPDPSINAIFIDIDDVDLSDEKKAEEFFRSHPCEYVVNCAAYTAVDRAETDQINARKANAEIPGLLARLSSRYGFKIIHISTDYVFSGEKKGAYLEEDTESEEEIQAGGPQSVYGITKREGEQSLLQTAPDSIIIRTAWLYSEFGKNFVKTMVDKALTDQRVRVVADQKGNPTYAGDLARAIVKILKHNVWQPGIYHFTNTGNISWYDLTTFIYESIGKDKSYVSPISTGEYPVAAKRPVNSVLSTDKIEKTYGIDIADWQNSVLNVIKKLTHGYK